MATFSDGVSVNRAPLSDTRFAEGSRLAEGSGLADGSVNETAVVLSIPNDRSFLRVVRLVVASLAADQGYDYEEIEDLRTASDELVNLVMSGSRPTGRIHIEIAPLGDSFTVGAAGDARNDTVAEELDPLGLYVVRVLVDDFGVTVYDGRLEAKFQTRPPSRSNDV